MRGRPAPGRPGGGPVRAVNGGPWTVPGLEECNAPVTWRGKWLQDHPGGTIGRPDANRPELEAAVDGVVLASAVTMSVLMSRAQRAEDEGRCPRHPGAAP